jgi:hypothetical protein
VSTINGVFRVADSLYPPVSIRPPVRPSVPVSYMKPTFAATLLRPYVVLVSLSSGVVTFLLEGVIVGFPNFARGFKSQQK